MDKLKGFLDIPGKLIPIAGSKKGQFSIGIAVMIYTLASSGLPDMVKYVAMGALAVVALGYNIGQGIADYGKESTKIEMGVEE